MKTVLLWILALLMLAAPGAAEAITVSIQVQKTGFTSVTATPTVTFVDHTGKPAVALACDTAAKVATAAACTRVVSIGGTPVTIRDLGPCTSVATCVRARIYRDDAQSSDILNIAGLLATFGTGTTTAAPVTLTISYSSNEFTKLNYSSGYSYTAVMSGAFFNGGATAPRCLAPFTTACLTLKLTANNTVVNQFGDNAVATVNVGSAQVGAVGAFGPPGNPSETKSIPCGTINVLLSCTPSLQGELTAISVKANDTLKIAGGAAIAGSHRPTTAGGVTDTFTDGAVPEFVNAPVPVNFVRYDQAATLHATLQQDGQLFPKAGGSGQMPLWWNLEKVDGFTPADTVLKSIVTNTDGFDDGAYVSAVLTNLKGTQPRDLTSLVTTYNGFTPCSNPSSPLNSFFVEIQLKTTPVQAIRVLLDCANSSGVNLVSSANVVKLPDGSTTNWKGMLNQFGGVDIRAISVFLTPITTPTAVDQEVTLDSLTFVAFKTTFTQSGGQTPTFADMKCDFPGLNEFTVRATPVDANGVPVGPPFIWGDAPGETFQKVQDAPTAGDCQLRTAIPINVFPPNTRQNAWRFELLYNLVPSGFGTLIVAENN